MGGQFDEEKWKIILGDSIEPVAKGTWSPNGEGPAVLAGLRRYGASKLCLAMMMYVIQKLATLFLSANVGLRGELQQRLDRDPLLNNISVLGVDPGWMATSISRRHPMYSFVSVVMPWVAGMLSWLQPSGMYRTPGRSAKDVIAASLGIGPVNGIPCKGLYYKGAALAQLSTEAKDEKKREMVWKSSVEYAGLQQGDTVLLHWN